MFMSQDAAAPLTGWSDAFADLHARIAGRFARVEVRDRAERDLAVFRARNPALAGMPAVTTLAVLARTCARTGGAAEPPAKAPDFPDDPGQWSR